MQETSIKSYRIQSQHYLLEIHPVTFLFNQTFIETIE